MCHKLCWMLEEKTFLIKAARILAIQELCLVVPTYIKQMSQILHLK